MCNYTNGFRFSPANYGITDYITLQLYDSFYTNNGFTDKVFEKAALL
ncbi:hypothetical protein ACHRV1_18300 [Flavobacterium aquidurense]|nr:hypothetical protein [Flavobacterium aquidurense]